jgi:hypothetical protein
MIFAGLLWFEGKFLQFALIILLEETLGGLGLSIPSFKLIFLLKVRSFKD